MPRWSSPLSLAFSCVGHSYSHLFFPIFGVAIIAMESEFAMSHGALSALVVLPTFLYGIAAPAAGWLGDRWKATSMMALFFFGTGGGMVLLGTAETAREIEIYLIVTACFAAIYHPVGMAWLMRNAIRRGTAMGVNNLFGTAAVSGAFVIAGFLIDTFGWQSAFFVPGLVIVATGVVFVFLLWRGVIVEIKTDRKQEAAASNGDRLRAFFVLMVTLVCSGLIYQSTQVGLPKMFSVRIDDVFGDGVLGVSALVSVVYGIAALSQVAAGWLADRYPLKYVYVGAWCFQVPFLILAANTGGLGLVLIAGLMVTGNVGGLPAENVLVGRFAPGKYRGLVYGMKFILAFGIASLGIRMEGALYDATGDFFWLFTVLACIAAVAVVASLWLPGERREQPVAAPAAPAE